MTGSRYAALAAFLAAVGAAAVGLARDPKPGDKSFSCLIPCEDKKPVIPPPCRFFQQLREYEMLQAMFANKGLRATAMGKAKKAATKGQSAADISHNAGAVLNDDIVANSDFVTTVNAMCPAKNAWNGHADVPPPPGLETSAECSISLEKDTANPKTLDQLNQTFATCSELLDADYQHEGNHKKQCFSMSSTARTYESLDAFANEEVESYAIQIKALRDAYNAWRLSCTRQRIPFDKTTKQAMKAVKALRGGK